MYRQMTRSSCAVIERWRHRPSITASNTHCQTPQSASDWSFLNTRHTFLITALFYIRPSNYFFLETNLKIGELALKLPKLIIPKILYHTFPICCLHWWKKRLKEGSYKDRCYMIFFIGTPICSELAANSKPQQQIPLGNLCFREKHLWI